MKMTFYVTLQGRGGELQALLPVPMDLSGYYVGVVSICIPKRTWRDIDDMAFQPTADNDTVGGLVPGGNYEALAEYCATVQSTVNHLSGKDLIGITAFEPQQVVTVHARHTGPRLVLSNDLRACLGLHNTLLQGVRTTGNTAANVLKNYVNLTSNIVEKSSINATAVSVIATVPLRCLSELGTPHFRYAPVSVGWSDHVSVKFLDEQQTYRPFRILNVVVSLFIYFGSESLQKHPPILSLHC